MSGRKRRKHLPRLRPEHLDDYEAFVAVLDKAAETTPGYRRLTKQILRLQHQLRDQVDDRAWDAFIALEAAVNARNADVVEHVVRWGFVEGRRRSRED